MVKKQVSSIVLGSLLSLALFALANKAIDWSAEKCPWDTDNAKIALYIAIGAVTLYLITKQE